MNSKNVLVVLAIALAIWVLNISSPVTFAEDAKLPVQNPTIEQTQARKAALEAAVPQAGMDASTAATDADKAIARLRLNAYQCALGGSFVDIPLNNTPEMCELAKTALVTAIGETNTEMSGATDDATAYVASVRLARYRSALSSLNGCGGHATISSSDGSGSKAKASPKGEPSAFDKYVDSQAARWADQAKRDNAQDEAIGALASRVATLESGQADVAGLTRRVETTERQIHSTSRQARLDRRADREAASSHEATMRRDGWVQCKDADGDTIWVDPRQIKRCH